MRRCPKCGDWTLEFDDYFGRFRCYNADCGWMPPSSAEREIRLIRQSQRPELLHRVTIDSIGLTLTSSYDKVNDALIFDFGLTEPTFDLPDPDGRVFWRIGCNSGSVAGVVIMNARNFDASAIRIDVAARKESIENRLRRYPDVVASGRATRLIIDEVVVTAQPVSAASVSRGDEIATAFKETMQKLRCRFLQRDEPTLEQNATV